MRVTGLYKMFRRLLAASAGPTPDGGEAVRMPDATRLIRAAQEHKKAPPSAGRLALLLHELPLIRRCLPVRRSMSWRPR